MDFLEVALPTPPGGWEKNRLESGNSADQTRAYERFQLQKDAQAAAMQVVKELHLASNAEHAVNGTSPHRPSGRTHLTIAEPFPESLLEQMRSCHNAATEFLRQYWSAILPTPTGAVSSAAAIKTARAGKMADYLRRTEGKVEAVIHTATIVGVDPARVRAVSRMNWAMRGTC